MTKPVALQIAENMLETCSLILASMPEIPAFGMLDQPPSYGQVQYWMNNNREQTETYIAVTKLMNALTGIIQNQELSDRFVLAYDTMQEINSDG